MHGIAVVFEYLRDALGLCVVRIGELHGFLVEHTQILRRRRRIEVDDVATRAVNEFEARGVELAGVGRCHGTEAIQSAVAPTAGPANGPEQCIQQHDSPAWIREPYNGIRIQHACFDVLH